MQRRRSVYGLDEQERKHRPDYGLLVLISVLLVCGAVVVYAIGPGLTGGTNLGTNYFSVKQLISIGFGVFALLSAALIPLARWRSWRNYILGLAVVSAFAVRIVGDEVNGAHRWLQVGGFSFQSAELVKLALVLWLANYLASVRKRGAMKDVEVLKVLGIISVSVILVVAGLQSDLGSATVMLAITAVLAFVAGLPMKKIFLAGAAVLVLVALAISTSAYRRQRVETFLNPTADCQVSGYQACQALITIGSGGISGKGLGKSVQAYGYLPEPANDSIFAIVSEKFGFVGAATLIGVFWLLFRKLLFIARATTTEYSTFVVIGVLVWLSTQMFINVGAMMGLMPLKGITLPFVSYGGTSIIFVMFAIGLVFQISRYTDLTKLKMQHKEVRNIYDTPRRYR